MDLVILLIDLACDAAISSRIVMGSSWTVPLASMRSHVVEMMTFFTYWFAFLMSYIVIGSLFTDIKAWISVILINVSFCFVAFILALIFLEVEYLVRRTIFLAKLRCFVPDLPWRTRLASVIIFIIAGPVFGTVLAIYTGSIPIRSARWTQSCTCWYIWYALIGLFIKYLVFFTNNIFTLCSCWVVFFTSFTNDWIFNTWMWF